MRTQSGSLSLRLTPWILIWIAASTGCANLERNLQDPAVWNRVAQISDRYSNNIRNYEAQKVRDAAEAAERRRLARQPRDMAVTGFWSFTSGSYMGFNTTVTKSKTNRITQVDGGILAKRKGGKGQGDFYARVGHNTYRNNSGSVYRFNSRDRAVWQKPGGKPIKLYRQW